MYLINNTKYKIECKQEPSNSSFSYDIKIISFIVLYSNCKGIVYNNQHKSR